MIPRFNLGDVVKMKKPHPCGGDLWEITRTGLDIGMRCLGCGRKVMLPRVKFERRVRKVLAVEDLPPEVAKNLQWRQAEQT